MKNHRPLILGVSLLLISLLATPAQAVSARASAARDWSQWLAHYYQVPQSDQIVPAVFALSRSGYFEEPGQPATAIGFLSAVFAQNPDKVADWMAAFRDLPVAHQRLVASALWYSGLPGSDRQLRALARNCSPELRGEFEQLLAQGAKAVRETPVLSESSLNLQWGAFLATGDSQHIVNALAALGSGEPGLSTAARLALAEKAATHPRVYEICQAQLARQPANVRDQMRAALMEVKVKP
jgi:hypothetical protein